VLAAAAQLLLAAAPLLPIWTAWLLIFRARLPRASAAELLLAASIALAATAVGGVALLSALGGILFVRPLDAFALLTWAAAIAATVLLALKANQARDAFAHLALALRTLRTLPLPVRLFLTLALLAHAAVAALALWSIHWGPDATNFLIPQALQPHWDGRLATVETPLPFGDTYPRSAALLRAALLFLGGGDAAFNATSVVSAVIAALATYTLSRRLRVPRSWAVVAGSSLLFAPILSLVCTNGNVDAEAAAALLTAAALALPRGRGWGSPATRLALVAAAIILAVTTKFIAVGFAGVVALAALASIRRTPDRPRLAVAFSIVTAALSAIPYALTWRTYGSPIYPAQLKIGPYTLFGGPMAQDHLVLRPDGPVERFARSWFEWYNPLTTESLGSGGPLFGLLGIPGLLVLAVATLFSPRARPLAATILILGALLTTFLLPQQHLPRYALHLLAFAAVGWAFLAAQLRGPARTAGFALTLLAALWSASLFWSSTHRDLLAPALAESGTFPARLGDAGRRSRSPHPGAPSPPMLAAVRATLRPGETLAFTTTANPVALTDARFSYAVRYRPPRPGEPEAQWARALYTTAHAVLVPAPSTQSAALSSLPDLWALARDESHLPGGTRLFRRVAATPLP
jgi:hypothetical protein